MNKEPLIRPSPILRSKGLTRSYPMRENERLEVLKGIDFEIFPGEAVAIVGASGAGKSTLLHILGTLDRPTLGKVYFKGQDLTKESDDFLADLRLKHIGFVFQFHHLLSEFSAEENVLMPARIAGEDESAAQKRVDQLFTQLGLLERRNHFPTELSGGEQQRVAIARALMMRPEILLADEPTGNLDTANAEKIQELFFSLKEKHSLTLIAVTHDLKFASRFPRVLRMRDGTWEA